MSKDEALGRLIQLAERCDEQTILKYCDVLETALEPVPHGIGAIEDACSTRCETANDSTIDPGCAAWESALQMAITGF